LASISDVMSIFRRQQGFFPLFLLAAAKSALRNLTGQLVSVLLCFAKVWI